MKRWLLPGRLPGLMLAMLACCAVALAQQPDADEDQGVPGDVESAVVQGAAADPDTDVAKDAEDDAAEMDPGESAGAGDAETDGEPGGEPDEEFTPTEEIPEDYPVPLPSDI